MPSPLCSFHSHPNRQVRVINVERGAIKPYTCHEAHVRCLATVDGSVILSGEPPPAAPDLSRAAVLCSQQQGPTDSQPWPRLSTLDSKQRLQAKLQQQLRPQRPPCAWACPAATLYAHRVHETKQPHP
jgi:hypothetical protein